MKLRDALDLCSSKHADYWVMMPGNFGRPATTMFAGLFDPRSSESELYALTGNSISVYEPDASLSLVWRVPDDEESGQVRGDRLPEWAAADGHDWNSATRGWAVVLLHGAPIWQEPIWYIDWGSGIGGHVADFSPNFKDYDVGDDDEDRAPDGWTASTWSIGLAGLINSFSPTIHEFVKFDPTSRLVLDPRRIHPVDEAQGAD